MSSSSADVEAKAVDTLAKEQSDAKVFAGDVADGASSEGSTWGEDDKEYGFVHPKLVVLDLDDCVWHPEMYTLNQIPEKKVMGLHTPSDKEKCCVG
jgi:hypothetical protein